MKRIVLCMLVFGGPWATWSLGQQPDAKPSEEAAIGKADEAYVQAFNKHDAKALADAWSPEAVYVNRITGQEVVGRGAIAEQFAAFFKAQPEVKLELDAESIQFLSPNVAVEHGTARLVFPKAEPDQVDYSAVYVKRDGQWLLDRVTDKAKQAAASHYEQLKALEWMVGSWVDKDENVAVQTDCNWTKNKNFLTRSFTVAVGDQVETSGMQIIGWDPATKTIRSWTFDSEGGFAEATWTHKKDRWIINNKGILADGRKASMVNVIKPIDDNSFTWQTVERMVAGELLPNINEVLVVRQ